MKKNVWNERKRIAALLLAAALLLGALPQIHMEVWAETGSASGSDISLEDYTFAVSGGGDRIYDGTAVTADELSSSITITAEKSGEPTVTLTPGADCVIAAKTPGEWKNAGDYTLAVTPMTGSGYTFSEKEAVWQIQPFALTEDAVSLSSDVIHWTGEALTDGQWPVVTVRNGAAVLPKEDYQITTDRDVKDTGVYSIQVKPSDGSANLTGSATLRFEVKYDETIPDESCSFGDQNSCVKREDESGVYYYYKDASKVVFRPSAGYVILEEGVSGGIYQNGTVLLSDGVTEVVFRIRRIGGSGREIHISGFVKDTDGPTISFANGSVSYVNGTAWAGGAPEFTVEDAGVGPGPVPVEYRRKGEGESGWKQFTSVGEDDLKDGETYEFRGVDALSNVTADADIISCTIDKNDPEIHVTHAAETITFDANGTAQLHVRRDDLDTAGSKAFAIAVSDAGSGVKRTTVMVNGEDVADGANGLAWRPSDPQTAEFATIAIEAEDHVGHVTGRQILLYYDPAAPRIDDICLNGETAVSLAAKEDVMITAIVTDDLLNGSEQLESVELIEEDKPEAAVVMQRQEGSDLYACEIATTDFLEKTYRIVAKDTAQNVAQSVLISISIAKRAPEIRAVEMDRQPNEAGWIKEDATFIIRVPEPANYPKKIAYYLQYQKVEAGEAVKEDDAAWEWAMQDGEKLRKQIEAPGNYVFLFKEENDAFDGQYAFRIRDDAGNHSAYQCKSMKKDKILPEAEQGDILAQYASDLSKKEEKHGFLEGLKHFFGREEINVCLYIPQDRISGVKSIEYMYDGGVGEAEVNAGYVASVNGEAYAEFTLTLTKSAADKLKVTKITDYAGNSVTQMQEAVPVAEGNTILVIDHVAPVLTVDYLDADDKWEAKKGTDLDEDGRERKYYARADEAYKEIALTYTERFFLEQAKEETGQVVLPQIQINGTTLQEDSELVEWGDFDASSHTVTATLKLPYQKNKEVEYVIATSYQDGSENLLVTSDEFWRAKTEDGAYEAGTIVLDDKAPTLAAYGIKETPMQERVEDVAVYRNQDGDDVTISFTLEETDSYWHKENLRFVIRDLTHDAVLLDVSGEELTEWEEGRNLHTASVRFDGEANAAANYRAEIFYQDIAGNFMVGREDFSVTDGRYSSEPFILDHVNPVFQVVYNVAYRLVNNSDTTAGKDVKHAAPQTGYTAYYNEDIVATLTIREEYAHPVTEDGKIQTLSGFSFTVNGDEEKSPEIAWNYNGQTQLYTGTFTLKDEGRYQLGIRYQDVAGNAMLFGEHVQGKTAQATDDGLYQSETLVIDKTAPVLKTSYTTPAGEPLSPVHQRGERKYFDQSAYLKVEVEEVNFRNSELKESLKKLSAYTMKQPEKQLNSMAGQFIEQIADATIAGSSIWNVPLTTEANYDIPIACEDLAGNQASIATEYSCIDTGSPVNVKFTYSVEESSYKDVVNYKSFGYAFADHKLTMTALAEDAVAGIRFMEFTVTDETGETQVITKEFDPSASKKASIALPLSGKNFKGSVSVKVTDYSANESRREQGQIVETNAQHKKNGRAVITTKTEPSRTVDGEDYYNSDVEFKLTMEDMYSGIGSYAYVAGSALKAAKNYKEIAGDDMESKAAQKIVHKVTKRLTLLSSENNQNEVKVTAEFTDNAGHKSKVKQSYNIDVTKPKIDVTWDLNDPLNEEYFKETRTATVVITERNFDENDVEFQITNTDGAMPEISSFDTAGTGDETTHTATVTFSEDGDYTFALSFVDLAGNEETYDSEDAFTIDTTLPEYVVTYDNNSALNNHYYNEQRTATIDILEHNFDPASVTAAITKDNASAGLSFSGWSKNGDHNVATVTFDADGEYTFGFTGMDLAGNEMEVYAQDHFVVDRTEPEIEIFDIENHSANNGSVRPGIRYNDTNYDAGATVVEMKGFHNGVIDMEGTTSVASTGVELKMDDFAYEPDMDDLYTMHATVYDLAGNSSEAEVTFSVNRFGSVYTFDEETDDLVGDNGMYYTNRERDIVVTETNVDTLGFQEITCNYNGELSTLIEGEDYSIKQSGVEAGWKQYTYTMRKSLFEREGAYTITIYSEDQAKNKSDNSAKGKKVEFVVDKTPPSVLVSGVEDDGQYREDAKTVTVDVEDNVRLANVVVNRDGVKETYTAEQIAQKDGRIELSIPSKNQWQTLAVTAYDAAENQFDFSEIRYLITANFLIQIYENKPLFYSIIAAVAVLLAALYLFFMAVRRKKKIRQTE